MYISELTAAGAGAGAGASTILSGAGGGRGQAEVEEATVVGGRGGCGAGIVLAFVHWGGESKGSDEGNEDSSECMLTVEGGREEVGSGGG